MLVVKRNDWMFAGVVNHQFAFVARRGRKRQGSILLSHEAKYVFDDRTVLLMEGGESSRISLSGPTAKRVLNHNLRVDDLEKVIGVMGLERRQACTLLTSALGVEPKYGEYELVGIPGRSL